MNMTPGQWGNIIGAGGKALDAPNAQAYGVMVGRAGRCMPLPGWQAALLNGGPVSVLCYDGQGNEAGTRDMSAAERADLLAGARHVTQDGWLATGAEPMGFPGNGAGAGDSYNGLLIAGAVVAAGWWAYENWSTVSKWLSWPSGLIPEHSGKPLPRERVRYRSQVQGRSRGRTAVDVDDDDDDGMED